MAITNQRRFAARTVPLAEVKEIAKRSGVSLNDVVMATVAGGLREYLIGHRELPERPLSAAVPVSLRAAGDESANNQVSMVTMTLATDVADPLQRLKTIAAGSAETKAKLGRVKTAIPTDFPMLAAPWLMSGLASLFGRSRLANVLPPVANLVISNVPGIQQQLYFAGARIISYYPVSIPAHGMALNVTVQSYNGRLDYGLIGCRRAVPDIMDLADALLAEHRKLLALVRGPEAVAEPVKAEPLPAVPVKSAPKRRVGAPRCGAEPGQGRHGHQGGQAEAAGRQQTTSLRARQPPRIPTRCRNSRSRRRVTAHDRCWRQAAFVPVSTRRAGWHPGLMLRWSTFWSDTTLRPWRLEAPGTDQSAGTGPCPGALLAPEACRTSRYTLTRCARTDASSMRTKRGDARRPQGGAPRRRRNRALYAAFALLGVHDVVVEHCGA